MISGSIPAKFRGIPRNFAEFRRNWAEITSEVKKFRGIPCRRNSVNTLIIERQILKGTVRPDWIILRVVSLERPWKRHQPLQVFDFWFWFWIFEKASKFWGASYKNASNPPTCWDHGLYGHIPRSFPPNRAPKMREIQHLFLGVWLGSRIFEENQQSAIKTKIE